MSNKSDKKSVAAGAHPLAVEDQSQRRLKYGSNVILVSVIVIALAVLVIWLAQTQDVKLFGKRVPLRARPDLTSNSSNSLKPQTLSLVGDLNEKVTLVSLYPRLKEEERSQKEDTYDRVLNILEQYHDRNPDKISVLTIDPIAEPARLDAWISQLKRDYGQNISAYEDLLRGFPKTVEKIRDNATKQFKEMRELTQTVKADDFKGLTDERKESIVNTINVGIATVQQFPAVLDGINTDIRTELDKKIPDYDKGKNQLVSGLGQLSQLSNALATALKELRDDKTTPQVIRTYAEHAVPAFTELKRLSDDTISRANGLGKLKLDEVRRKLIPPDDTKSPPPAIVVMGKDDIRVIDFDSVWMNSATASFAANSNEKPRLRFAGEQQITRSILALSEPKQKTVVFVRDGGGPLTDASSQGEEDESVPAGPMSDIADRLRSYNFKVVEKDLSAQMRAMQMMQMAAQQPENQQMRMQAMQAQQRAESEPGDDVLKDAIWVVFPMPSNPRNPQPNVILGQRLKDHLEPQPAGGDLSVDDKDPLLVRSSSHSFMPGESGKTLEVTGGNGWTAGRYKIVTVAGTAAKLDRSPAQMKTADGDWELLGGVDLTVDAKDDKTVHSASHAFASSDKGDVLRIKPGGAWKAGHYKVTEVKDGAAVLDASPAPGGTNEGAWDIAPGSAFCFTSLAGDDLSPALSDYGIAVRNHAVLLHERVEATADNSGDFIETARRMPMIYVLNQYGDHPIAKPLNWLDSATQLPLPVEKTEKTVPGASVSMLLPIPETPRSWVETDLAFLFQRGAPQPKYHESDAKPPFYAGAVAERPGCGRLVVLGGYAWDFNELLRIGDPKMEKQHLQVSRFPANGELFTNSIFWLADEDQMIALSPSAMDTPRIASMGDGTLKFWRIGVFLIGLPLAALVSGLFVYRARRD